MTDKKVTAASLAAQAMGWIDPVTKAVVPPIHMASTYLRDEDNGYRSGRIYARADNPTFDQAEATLAALEGGAKALVFSSGMSAATACFLALAPGDHVVVPKVMYWSLRNWLATFATQWGLEGRVRRRRPDRRHRRRRPAGRHQAGLDRDAGQPDLGGHRHRRGGRDRAQGRRAARRRFDRRDAGADAADRARRRHRHAFGDQVPQRPFRHHRRRAGRRARRRALGEAARHPRPARHDPRPDRGVAADARHAHAVPARRTGPAARPRRWPRSSPRIPWSSEVLYPGLPSFAGHAAAKKQMTGGFGGMLSVRVKGGERAAIATAARVELWKRATSLGGVESLIEHRASIEGPGTPCPPDLLRLSVGVEDSGDLFDDLDQALRRAHNS